MKDLDSVLLEASNKAYDGLTKVMNQMEKDSLRSLHALLAKHGAEVVFIMGSKDTLENVVGKHTVKFAAVLNKLAESLIDLDELRCALEPPKPTICSYTPDVGYNFNRNGIP